MSGCAIAILARAPVPGRAKTRLVPRLGADGAAALQRQLIGRALARAAATRLPCTLWLDGAPDAALVAAAAAAAVELRTQPEGDLGARMLAACAHAHAAHRACIVIGTDCPAQTTDDLLAAAAQLAQADVVLQPAHDGGYVLIALRRPQPELFNAMPWGSEQVLALTRARCAALGLARAELRMLPDLDRPQDYDAALAAGWVQA